jgi:hypothetical protein
MHWRRALELGILTVLGAAGASWLALKVALPAHVRRICLAQAEASGIGLEIDDVRVSFQNLVLIGLHASAPDLAGARATAPEVDVAMSWLRPEHVTIQGLDLELTGPTGAVTDAFGRWRGSRAGGPSGEWPDAWTVDGATVLWKDMAGERTSAQATEMHLDVTWGARAAVLHARSEKLTVTTAAGVLGPWRIDLDQAPATSRLRIVFDPAVPDTGTLLALGDGRSITSVDAAIARAPLSRLGAQPLAADKNVAIAAALHFFEYGNGRADLTTKGGLFGISLDGLATPIDARWEGAATGNPRAGIEIRGAKLAVGPLVGDLRGTLKTFESGFRVDLAWRATPVPCAALAMPLGSGEISEILYNLHNLGAAAGKASGGTASATATLSLDSRDLGAFVLKVVPDLSCGRPAP